MAYSTNRLWINMLLSPRWQTSFGKIYFWNNVPTRPCYLLKEFNLLHFGRWPLSALNRYYRYSRVFVPPEMHTLQFYFFWRWTTTSIFNCIHLVNWQIIGILLELILLLTKAHLRALFRLDWQLWINIFPLKFLEVMRTWHQETIDTVNASYS